MIKQYKGLIGYLTGLGIMLFVFAALLSIFHTRPIGLLPDFTPYAPDNRFDVQTCDNFIQVPYTTGWGYETGESGYCTLTSKLPVGITQVNLYMKGSFILSAVFHVDGSSTIQDYLSIYGVPIKINRWGHTTQVNWKDIQLTYIHLDGGSVDNVKIVYVFIH